MRVVDPQNTSKGSVSALGEGAALLAATEIGLGSVMHALHLPLTGQVLSLNQGFLLTRWSLAHPQDKSLPAGISSAAALLKSLSPVGKKLTPMLAIAAQGVLFNLGTLIGGTNVFGAMVGMTLLSLWAYLQPLLIYLLIFGKTWIDVLFYFFEKVQTWTSLSPTTLLTLLAALVLLKILIGCSLVIFAYRLPENAFKRYLGYALRVKATPSPSTPSTPTPTPTPNQQIASFTTATKFKIVIRDLMQPMFLTSLAMTGVFYAFTVADATAVALGLIRPLAVGFVFFYFIRFFPLERFLPLESENRIVRGAREAWVRIANL